MSSTSDAGRDETVTDVTYAEREVARTKRQFHESLQRAGETGSRLAADARKQLTPTLFVAVAAGVVVVASVAIVASRSERRRFRPSNQPSAGGQLARAAGIWVLKAVALRVAISLAARFREPHTVQQPVP